MNQMKNGKLTPNAQKLRKDMTKEERHLWYDCLKHVEEPWKRQHDIGPYIVDFYCATAGLVVELDGSQHYENPEKDRIRDAYLNTLGIIVRRYSNGDIKYRFDGVCEDIYNIVQSRKKKPSP